MRQRSSKSSRASRTASGGPGVESLAAQELAQPGDWPGIDDVRPPHPSAARLAYPIIQIAELIGRMRIAPDGEHHAVIARRLQVSVVQIEARGLPVHLETATPLARRLEDAIEVERVRLALADEAARRMREDRYVRPLECAQQTPGLLR